MLLEGEDQNNELEMLEYSKTTSAPDQRTAES